MTSLVNSLHDTGTILELPGLPTAPEGGTWKWEKYNDKHWPYTLTLTIGDEEFIELLSQYGWRDDAIISAARVILGVYRKARRVALLDNGPVYFVPNNTMEEK